MSYPYFFVSPHNIDGQNIIIPGDDFKHLVKVLRSPVKSRVYLSDNSSFRYEAELARVCKDHALLSIISRHKIEPKLPRITLFQCVLKKAAMELLVQKACEIGADCIVPVISSRIVVDRKKLESKIGRWQKISAQACKQSKRDFITCINQPLELEKVNPEKYGLFYMPYERGHRKFALNPAKEVPGSIAFIIGPEGGFEQEETGFLEYKGALAVSLGKNILRAETASLYMLSVISYFFNINNG